MNFLINSYSLYKLILEAVLTVIFLFPAFILLLDMVGLSFSTYQLQVTIKE